MGDVYRARDTKLGRDVAIKVLPAAFGYVLYEMLTGPAFSSLAISLDRHPA